MKKTLNLVLFFFLLTLPIIGWILPADFFDPEGLILCPSRLLFGLECLGCGMTRAVMHFHHLDFGGAFYYNYFVIVMYPILVFIWGKWIWRLYQHMFAKPISQ